jgi:hypothetical protein
MMEGNWKDGKKISEKRWDINGNNLQSKKLIIR